LKQGTKDEIMSWLKDIWTTQFECVTIQTKNIDWYAIVNILEKPK
jgi:hypothetical protein